MLQFFGTRASRRRTSTAKWGQRRSTTISKDLMVSNQVRRPDVARVFFHTLVLHSRGRWRWPRPGQGNVLVSVAA